MLGTPLSSEALLARFSGLRLLVVGDVMLDRFLRGTVSRVSSEAPVPVVEVRSESLYPGGAANVARNLAPFAARVELAGLYGLDTDGDLLEEALAAHGIGMSPCLRREECATVAKTRVVARGQQVLRIDREGRLPPSPGLAEELLDRIRETLPRVDGVVVADHGTGLVGRELAAGLLVAAAERGLPVAVDPRPGNPAEWRGAAAVKPNRREAFAFAGRLDEHLDEGVPPLEDGPLLETGAHLLERWECGHLLLTLGEQGMLVFSRGSGPVHLPAKAREVFDVSGAGDTAIAIHTLGLCAGLPPAVAARVANLASGLVVGKLGTAPVEREELLEAVAREFPDGVRG